MTGRPAFAASTNRVCMSVALHSTSVSCASGALTEVTGGLHWSRCGGGRRDETGQATSKVGRGYAEANHRALSQDSAVVDIQRIADKLSGHVETTPSSAAAASAAIVASF